MSHVEAVRDWLRERNPDVGEIGDDLDLVEHRVVDSLRLVEFLFFLESLTGREIPRDALKLAQFRTLADIERNFLAGAAARQAGR